MNSIIKHINYDEFVKLIGTEKFNTFIDQNQNIILCFIADWSVPSRIAIKKIKKMNILKNLVGIIDVDLVDSIELCDAYEIKAVPHFIVMKNKEILSQFTGCRVELIIEAFSRITIQSKSEKNITKCKKNHNLQFLNTLPQIPYIDNYFYCNQCLKIQLCSQKSHVGHCDECDYDICHNCSCS